MMPYQEKRRVGSLFCPPMLKTRVGTKRRAHPTQILYTV